MKRRSGVGVPVREIASRLERISTSPWFAYGSVLAIQAKVLWGIWEHRDLSDGDSSEYFASAVGWSEHLWVSPLFSPIYTALWGSLRWLVEDTLAVTIAHRALIVLAVSLAVLAVTRRLLSPAIAWVVAVWWVLLAINYDTRNEVHLIAMLPLLGAVLLALRFPVPRGRAAVFGVLLATAVLVRNEVVIAAAAWLLACAGYELWRRRWGGERADPAPRLSGAVAPFVVAALVVVAIGALSLSRAPTRLSPSEWADAARFKQDFALCQHYALGYEQRDQGYISRGFTDCGPFMRRDFGEELPSFTEALRSNPGAMIRHFLWNTELAPYGLQLALFDRTSGSRRRNPDYIEARTGSALALAGSVAVVAVALAGSLLLWRDRRRWWAAWIRERVWGWTVLVCLAAMGIWVVVTTHPAPAYFFPLTFALLCGIGLCAMALADRWPRLAALRAGLPLVAVGLLGFVPPHYDDDYSTPVLGPGRGLADAVSRLEPYGDQLAGSGTVLVGPRAYEICNYLTPLERCTPGPAVESERLPASLGAWLDLHGADFVYDAGKGVEGDPLRRELAKLEAHGWRRIAPLDSSADWLLLGREPAQAD